MNTITITTALFIAFIIKFLVDAISKPVKEYYPQLPSFYILYLSWLVAGVIVYLSGLNIFDQWIFGATVGRVLTAFAVASVANFLHDLTNTTKLRAIVEDVQKSYRQLKDNFELLIEVNKELQNAVNVEEPAKKA